MKDANQVVDRANGEISQLTESMREIFNASEETLKIVKTIDKIAFQSNLLALNEAVDAARNSAALIDDTSRRANGGSAPVAQANEALGEETAAPVIVGDIVDEIATASNEQAQALEQIKRTVTHMDKVVQQNPASAEEFAPAARNATPPAPQAVIPFDANEALQAF